MLDKYVMDPQRFAAGYLKGMAAVMADLPLADINMIVDVLASAYEGGRRIFVAGNGGSAASAAHMACDLNKSVLSDSEDTAVKRFAVVALADNIPTLTAWANDTRYDQVFSQPLRNLAQVGDVLIVISASGNSKNIVHAAEMAKKLGLTTIGLLGFEGGAVRAALDQALVVHSNDYGYIEDAHMIVIHLVTAYFREALRMSALSMST